MKPVVLLKVEMLDEYLVRRNLSRHQFARSAGMSGCYFSQIMQRQRNPGERARQKILAATQTASNQKGMDFDQLFEIVSSPTPKHKVPDAAPVTETAMQTPSKLEVSSCQPLKL